MTVVDAHQHVWDPAQRAYGWMAAPGLEPLRRPFGVSDLRAAIAATPVERTVFVQAVPALEETRELLAAAAGSGGLIAGVVGWVDLAADVERALAELRAGPGGELLVGIRHQAEDERDPEWLLRPDVLRGLAAVERAGLVYDLLVRPPQLPAAARAVRELPGLRFVLDHGGKPPIASGGLDGWRALIAELADAPNVVCKLSGLVTEAERNEDVVPVAGELLEAFGPDRLMYGSDWPVCTLKARYGEVFALAEAVLPPAARDRVLGGVATEVYGLRQIGGLSAAEPDARHPMNATDHRL
ncbi:MAG TPA: amidohydrolase family protein [Solirubrobacteraceae bacterium]|nr:amidohydrolase family protein [Solirubrobacteraceae bacterium]